MYLKLFRNLLLLFCLFSVVKGANAQTGGGNATYFTPTVFPLSPNSTAFTKFGNYPVNLYSGLPDISIPLYTVEAGGLSVPVTLSYHASGNKIADVASWVGLGWSVNSGGSCTRVISGLQDDNGYLKGDMKTPSDLHPETNNADIDYLRNTVENQAWDNMPDIFSYQVPGYSGKFFFDGTNNYKIEKIPFAPLNITALTATDTIAGFNIVDAHGNYFGLGRTYREKTGFNHGTAISAWMLENMISQNKRDTIKFAYSTDNLLQYPDGMTETITVEDFYNTVLGPPNSGYVGSPVTTLVNNPSVVIEQQMSTITYKNGRVDFIKSASRRTDIGSPLAPIYGLDTIKVSAYNYGTKKMEVQKQVVFYKSYFNASITGAQRLRLDSIQVLDKAGSVMQHYRFTYNTTLNLPVYGSLARDYWGYYNGKTANTDLVPKMTIQCYNDGGLTYFYRNIGSSDSTSRDCDSNYMQANMLTRIDYPTGGYTTFAYQTNRYKDSAHIVHLAGGLRIQQISDYDSPTSITPVMVKTYQYNTSRSNFITDGNTTLNYNLFSNSQTYRFWVPMTDTHGNPIGDYVAYTKRVRRYAAQPNMDLAPDAMPVTYANVTEYEGTPGANIGKTVYTYTDAPSDDFQAATLSGIPITYSFFFARGQLADKKIYLRTSGGSYQIVKDESSSFAAFPYRYYGSVGLAIGQANYNDGSLGGGSALPPGQEPDDYVSHSYPYSWYAIVAGDNLQTGATTKIYDINDTSKYVTSSSTYSYDDTTHLQLTSAAHTDSRGNTRTTASKYPYNYASGNPAIDTMVRHNMYAEAIEKTDTYTTSSGTTTTGAQLNLFKFGTQSGIVPSKISTLSVAQPLTDFTPSAVVSGSVTSDSRYKQMISFDDYDTKNNLTQYTPRNATPTAILWNYTYELPVAQIKNAPNYSTSVTSYAYTGFEADSKGGWTYSGTPLFDNTAPAGSYSYPLNAGAVTSGTIDNSRSYVLSYWSHGAAATVTYNGTGYTGASLRTANGWTYYEHQLPVTTGTPTISISGSVSIDELRLYPANAQMTTYNYDPSGLRSISDTKGANSYFEYDFLERLKNIKDWAGNIVKNYGYHMYDMGVGNQSQTGTFTRTTCPINTTPGSLTYTVPANRYYGTSQASANADAIYDMKLNGQIKANANCGCPPVIPVQVTNSTGITGYPITFSGISSPYNVPTGVSTIYVPTGTYTSVQVGPFGSGTYNFVMGTRPAQNGVHYATFTSVSIVTGSSDLTISITP